MCYIFTYRQLCRARPSEGSAKAVDCYLKVNLAISLEPVTSGHPMKKQANPLFGFILKRGSYLNW